MLRSKPTQASLPESEIRDALEDAANYLSKTPMVSKRLLSVAEAISLFLNSDKLTLDQALGLKRGKRQYERPFNEKHIALVCSALDKLLGDDLVIPLRDALGVIHSLQFINREGDKRFMPGGRVRGCYFSIDNPKSAKALCIAAGFATGASICETTKHPSRWRSMRGTLKLSRRRYERDFLTFRLSSVWMMTTAPRAILA